MSVDTKYIDINVPLVLMFCYNKYVYMIHV